MNQKVAQGALLLGISLAAVGAVATSPDADAASETATDATVTLQSELLASIGTSADAGSATAAATGVPIRSGRLHDQEVTESVQPVAVRVGGIALEANVIPVGVDGNNQFAVPAADTVGWYQYSSSPGEAGASVLAAHVDYGGAEGAFFNLEKLLPGDRLEVEMADGRVIDYVVTGNTEYDKTELPADDLFRKDGESVLQLITCGGTFDPGQRSYQANVVVTAVPVTA